MLTWIGRESRVDRLALRSHLRSSSRGRGSGARLRCCVPIGRCVPVLLILGRPLFHGLGLGVPLIDSDGTWGTTIAGTGCNELQ